jgi:hypothetical protein
MRRVATDAIVGAILPSLCEPPEDVLNHIIEPPLRIGRIPVQCRSERDLDPWMEYYYKIDLNKGSFEVHNERNFLKEYNLATLPETKEEFVSACENASYSDLDAGGDADSHTDSNSDTD